MDRYKEGCCNKQSNYCEAFPGNDATFRIVQSEEFFALKGARERGGWLVETSCVYNLLSDNLT